jgi:hypothetical protein
MENSSKVILLSFVIIGVTLFSLLIISIITFFQGIAHGCWITLDIIQEDSSDIPSYEIYNLTRYDLVISPFLLAEFDLMIANDSYNHNSYIIDDDEDDELYLSTEEFESVENLIKEKISLGDSYSCYYYDCDYPEIFIHYENQVFSLFFSGLCA